MKKIVLSLFTCLLTVAASYAADYPNKTIRIIVPYQAGGVVDISARVIAQRIQLQWKQPVLIINRPGASGTIGVHDVAVATPDGYTWLMALTTVFTINPAILQNVPYDLDSDFSAVSLVSEAPLAIVAPIETSFSSVQGLTAFAKSQPNAIQYASAGVGTPNHLLGEWLGITQKFKVQHIPYNGGAPAMTATLRNEVQFGVLSLALSRPLAQSGKLKILAIASLERSAIAPEIPTLTEEGVPIAASVWVGLFTQKKVPIEINKQIHDSVVEVLKDEDVKAALLAGGIEARSSMESRDFQAQIKTEESQYRDIIQKAKILK
jgi:tripartite-type tricarboxylate transporter receptor subunit TctC